MEALREEVVSGALELAHVRARARSLRPAVRAPGCPYPGLAGFGPADADLFHGRERMVAQVLARLTAGPLLALVGDAGTGKTSLLRAGVLPAITAGVLPDSSRWRQVVVTPSTMAATLAELMAPPPATPAALVEHTRSNPLTTPTALLPIAVATPPLADGPDETVEDEPDPGDQVPDFAPTGPEADDDAARPQEPSTGLGQRNGILPTGPANPLTALTPTTGLPALRLPLARTPAVDVVLPGAGGQTVRSGGPDGRTDSPDEPAPTLLVVDQFEEIFVLLDDRQRDEFAEALLHATETGRVLISMRSDFYRHCARYAGLAELVAANLVPVAPMTEDELRRAIVRPAEIAGLEVEPGLADRLIAEVEDGNGGLAHLAVTLRELWHGRNGTTLTLAAYQAGPGLGDAIGAYAESVFAGLPTPQARTAARELLAGMCALTEDRLAVRSRANLTELLARAGGGALPAIEVLAAGGLVTISPEIDAVTLRHDSLLTAWPRLREALDDTAAETSLRRHLRRAADTWAANGRASGALYRGARLVTVLDWAERHGAELSTVEREFLAAGQRVVLATELRRKRRMMLLWKWVAGTTALALLATAIAVVSVVMQVRTAASAQRSDAARLGVLALAEPDLRDGLLLAIAATRLDAEQAGVLRAVLQRTPDLVAMAGAEVTAVAVSPDGAAVAAGTADGPVLLLTPDGLGVSATLDYPGHGPVNGLTFTPDGRRLVSWGGSRNSSGTDAASIVVWDLASRRPTGTAFGLVWPGASGGLLADGVTLVLVQHGRDPQAPASAVAWNIDTRTPSTTYPLPSSTVESVVVSPDGSHVAFGTGGATVVLTVADAAMRTLPGAVTPLAFTRDGEGLLTAAGPEAQVWDLAALADDDPAEPRTLLAHRDQVLDARWAPDGESFATVGADGAAVVWSLETLTPLRSFTAGPTPMTAVWFAPDARTLYTASGDGSVLAFDLTGGRGVGTELASTSDTDSTLVTLACGLTGRGMNAEEWGTHLPDRPYQQTCP
jgi:WD40 repeat protein